LQCVAVRCSALQCVARLFQCFVILQCVAVGCQTPLPQTPVVCSSMCRLLPCVAMCCNVLQCVTACCSVCCIVCMHRALVRPRHLHPFSYHQQHTPAHCNTLCNTLQHTVQHTASHCATHCATHCITLQQSATCLTTCQIYLVCTLHGKNARRNATHCNALQHAATH